jgi:nucleotide-binding universal stress UspA family protein
LEAAFVIFNEKDKPMKFFKSKEAPMKIMACYKASESADEALNLAQKYAQKWGASIDVVCAVKKEEPGDPSSEKEIEEAYKSRIKKRFDQVDIHYDAHMLNKPFSPGEQLVMFAEKNDYEFIFVGISKRSKTGKLLYGSTAQYVILNAPCPVISTNGFNRIFKEI